MTVEGFKAQAILLSDGSRESNRAKALLSSKGIQFEERTRFDPEEGLNPPILYASSGEFRGIEGVKAYIEIIE